MATEQRGLNNHFPREFLMEDTDMKECLNALMTLSIEALAGLSLAMLTLQYQDDTPRIKEHIRRQIRAAEPPVN